MTRRPARKVVPVKVRCSMIDNKGQGCNRQREYRMTRADGTSQELCKVCAYKIRDQQQHYPTYFGQVRFTQLNPREQLVSW
jgi:hypothetical protein